MSSVTNDSACVADLARDVEHVLREWSETMAGDNKAAAVVRGMNQELRAVIAPYVDANA